MARFDPELYLREWAEVSLLRGETRRSRMRTNETEERAEALVATGVISGRRASRVLKQYSLARRLRDGSNLSPETLVHWGARGRTHRDPPLESARFVPCEVTVELASGRLELHYVSLSARSTTLGITFTSSGPPRAARTGPPLGPWIPPPTPSVQLADDRGTQASTNFSGHGSDDRHEGDLTADRPLSPETRWIEVDGRRVELTRSAVACEVGLEELDRGTIAERYLRSQLAAGASFGHGPRAWDGEDAVEALVAAGRLGADDPVIAELKAVSNALESRWGGPSAGAPQSLPEPWRTYISQRATAAGRQLRLPLGALTPPFDGFQARVLYLRGQSDGFSLKVEMQSPPSPVYRMWHSSNAGLAWWAEDDRGHVHLGSWQGWSGGATVARGDLHFQPGLHPQARRLRILPTAMNARGVVEFALPEEDK